MADPVLCFHLAVIGTAIHQHPFLYKRLLTAKRVGFAWSLCGGEPDVLVQFFNPHNNERLTI